MNSKDRLRKMLQDANQTGEDMEHERGRFDRIKNKGPTKAISAFNLFQTPETVADEMVDVLIELVGTLDGKRILEPSAGLGRLYRALRLASTSCSITLVEQSADCSRELYGLTNGDDKADQIQDDFLACDAERLGGKFDCILMNPPFKNGLDIKHVRHAYDLLKDGGAIVAICANGPRQAKAFSDWNRQDLPLKSFEGTSVNASMIWTTK